MRKLKYQQEDQSKELEEVNRSRKQGEHDSIYNERKVEDKEKLKNENMFSNEDNNTESEGAYGEGVEDPIVGSVELQCCA